MSKTSALPEDLMSAVDAAKVLGLSADMVRLLARDGRLPTAAQTIRGVRLFRRSEVEMLAAERAGIASHDHVVQFYEETEGLSAFVAKFIGVALRVRAPVAIIAREAHRNAFCAQQARDGIDVEGAINSGQLVLHDARELLDQFMVGGMPDEGRFRDRIGAIIEKAVSARPRPRLRMYGEMVDILWADGNRDAAIKLESLWNDLGREQAFSLLCAYDMRNFQLTGDAGQFEDICRAHSQVIPAEDYADDLPRGDRLRQIAKLQQRARSLEGEIEQRKRQEDALRGTLSDLQEVETELEARREELKDQNESLDEARRAKDEFFAVLSHELRNPLAPIQTALELMRMRGDESREVALIERQVGRLVRLVDDLLDVSRLTRGKVDLHRRSVDLEEVIKQATESAGPLLDRRRHQLDVQVPVGIRVDVDLDRMAQVVSNLLTNAAKYSEPGSQIKVRGSREGGSVQIEVEDEGIGIVPELIDRVFETFVQKPQTLERPLGGLGLGLAIVHNLVALHGGTVTVHSDGPGKGSRFTVVIPDGVSAVQIAPDPLASGPSLPVVVHRPSTAKPRRILIVDDNEDLASLIAELLEHQGHAVQLAHDGPSALEVAARFQPDMALLDIGLPVMDGYELGRQLRDLRSGEIQLVAVTGYSQEADRKRSEEAGFSGHLVKPLSPELLARLVEKA